MRTIHTSLFAWLLTGLLAPAVADDTGISVHLKDLKGRPLAGVVVIAHAASAVGNVTTPNTVSSPSGSAPATDSAPSAMLQQDLQFDPGVLVIQAGTPVLFPNNDNVMHHVYSFSPAKSFELPLYNEQVPPPVQFDTPGVAVIGCNIHDHMLAHIVVVDTPYFATTDAQGHARIATDPASVSSLVAWSPGWGELGEISQTLDGRHLVRWQIDRKPARRQDQDTLAWNEDY